MKKKKYNAKIFAGLRKTAAKHFGIVLEDADCIRLLDSSEELRDEAGSDGYLDTAGRDYLSMAIIEDVMPGPPTVQDDLLGGDEYTAWHWPCFGSDDEYCKAFRQAYKKGLKAKGYKVAEGTQL